MVRNQGTKQRVQRILGDCWQWETNGQCVKGDSCSFRHDMNKRGKSYTIKSVSKFFHAAELAKTHREPEVPEAEVPVVECHDGLARITSEELAKTHFVESGTLQNACTSRPRVVAGLERSAHIAHRQVDEQLTKRSKTNNDKSAVAMLKKGEIGKKENPVSDGSSRSNGATCQQK